MPIDRHYIEKFLNQFAASVQGHVLEVGDDFYSRKFGNGRVTRQDVIHVVPGTPGATIIADLTDAPDIPSEQFDCIILTQTLHFIYDLQTALSTVARILKPGGALLVTLPGISQVCRDQLDLESDSWRFTRSSAHRLFHQHFPAADLHVQTYGNVLAATAFLYGLATSDLNTNELDHHDPDYPVTIGVRVVKAKNL
jgi:SAM-dependent methyltransferase